METLTAQVQSGILYLTISNSQHGNSFGREEAELLDVSLKRFQGNFDGILLQAEGDRFFCTGGNLRSYASLRTRLQGIKVNLRIRQVLKKLNSLPQPKVAVVTGDCFGGGLEVLSVFDRVFAVPEACVGFWQRRLGLTFGWGGGARWEKKLGVGSMLACLLEARTYSSYEAVQLGMIHRVILRERIGDEALQWLKQVIQWPKEPLKDLRGWKTEKESKIFDELWLNPSHKRILDQFSRH